MSGSHQVGYDELLGEKMCAIYLFEMRSVTSVALEYLINPFVAYASYDGEVAHGIIYLAICSCQLNILERLPCRPLLLQGIDYVGYCIHT